MEKIRFGIYGYGKVAQLHARALKAAEHVELVSVCGRDRGKREDFATRWNLGSHDDVESMVKEDGVQAVLVATPHPLHAPNSIEAMAAGCHVLTEKPMALSLEDADATMRMAESARVKLGVVSQRRWYPACRRVKEAIDSGLLGKPALGEIIMLGWRDEKYYTSDPWRGTWSGEGGGVLVNQAPHQLDLISWFMGPVSEVYGKWANVNHPYIEVDDSAVAIVRFASGGMASIFVSNSQKPGIFAKVHVHGSSGASAGVQTDGGAMFLPGRSGIAEPPVNDLWTIPGQEDMLETWRREDAEFFSKVDATWYFFSLQAEDFARAILESRDPLVTGSQIREAVKIMTGIYRSSETGEPERF